MLWLNIFKCGVSISIGLPGFRFTLGRSNVRGTVGLTGTGLFLTRNIRHSAFEPRRKIRTNKTLENNHGKKES
jgi:hypothetical protein